MMQIKSIKIIDVLKKEKKDKMPQLRVIMPLEDDDAAGGGRS